MLYPSVSKFACIINNTLVICYFSVWYKIIIKIVEFIIYKMQMDLWGAQDLNYVVNEFSSNLQFTFITIMQIPIFISLDWPECMFLLTCLVKLNMSLWNGYETC